MKTKHKWQTQEVWIMKRFTHAEGGYPIDRDVSVGEQLTYRNIFAVHKIENLELWRITHIPTGYKFGDLDFFSCKDAKAYAEWLYTLPISWRDITTYDLWKDVPKELRKKMRNKAAEYEAL